MRRGAAATLAGLMTLLVGCGGPTIVRMDSDQPAPTTARASSASGASSTSVNPAPTTAAATAASTASPVDVNAPIRMQAMAPLGDSWGVVVGAASFDAREALLADVPTLPTLASTQRYVVVAAGVRYVGVSPIGLTTGIMREFVQGDGRSAIAQCPFATDLFDDTTVPPLVLAEVTVCGVVESAATDGLRLRMTEIATGRSVLLALHEGVGRDPDRQMTQAAPPSGGAIGSIGSPASAGVRVAIGPWFSATLDSVERLTIDGIPAGSVILRARWTLTTSAADRAAERAALSYGIFAGDRYQRYVGPCPTGALPTAPKLGTSTPIEQCAAVPAGEATTIYIHEGSGHAVGYFVIPAQ